MARKGFLEEQTAGHVERLERRFGDFTAHIDDGKLRIDLAGNRAMSNPVAPDPRLMSTTIQPKRPPLSRASSASQSEETQRGFMPSAASGWVLSSELRRSSSTTSTRTSKSGLREALV